MAYICGHSLGGLFINYTSLLATCRTFVLARASLSKMSNDFLLIKVVTDGANSAAMILEKF